MLNGNIIDCFNEIKEKETIVKKQVDRSNLISGTTDSDYEGFYEIVIDEKDENNYNEKDENNYNEKDNKYDKNNYYEKDKEEIFYEDKKLNKKIILENNIIYNDRWRYKETRINRNVRKIENT
jgi:hypothetical protein